MTSIEELFLLALDTMTQGNDPSAILGSIPNVKLSPKRRKRAIGWLNAVRALAAHFVDQLTAQDLAEDLH